MLKNNKKNYKISCQSFLSRLSSNIVKIFSHLNLYQFQQLLFTLLIKIIFNTKLVYNTPNILLISCKEFYLSYFITHVDIYNQKWFIRLLILIFVIVFTLLNALRCRLLVIDIFIVIVVVIVQVTTVYYFAGADVLIIDCYIFIAVCYEHILSVFMCITICHYIVESVGAYVMVCVNK